MQTVLTVQAITAGFFDREAVQESIDTATLKALSRFGAFVRRRAQTSMRRRKSPSAPGSPPSVHSGELKRLLFFAWDSSTKSVVVGPAAFGSRAGQTPPIQEFGGTLPPSRVSLVSAFLKLDSSRRSEIAIRASRKNLTVAQYLGVHHVPEVAAEQIGNPRRYPARPYMRPALDAERPKFSEQFSDSMR
jgi:hypothetical protein